MSRERVQRKCDNNDVPLCSWQVLFLIKGIVSALHDKIHESKSDGNEWKSYGQPDKQDNPQSFWWTALPQLTKSYIPVDTFVTRYDHCKAVLVNVSTSDRLTTWPFPSISDSMPFARIYAALLTSGNFLGLQKGFRPAYDISFSLMRWIYLETHPSHMSRIDSLGCL